MQTGLSPGTKIDKFAIILRPDTSSDKHNQIKKDEKPKMIGVIGTVTEGKELAYMLHCDYWRKGYMSEALRAFIGQNGLFWALESKCSLLRFTFVSTCVRSSLMSEYLGVQYPSTDHRRSQVCPNVGCTNRRREHSFYEDDRKTWGKRGREKGQSVRSRERQRRRWRGPGVEEEGFHMLVCRPSSSFGCINPCYVYIITDENYCFY